VTDRQLKERYEGRIATLEAATTRLEAITRTALDGLPHEHVDRVTYRVKGVTSFLAKAADRRIEPPYEEPLAEIEDQIAGRVIVFFTHDLEPAVTLLGETFNRVEAAHRRPPADDAFGYESHHFISVIPHQVKGSDWSHHDPMPNTFELQVRTLFMHAYAEPQHDFGYKRSSDMTSLERRRLAWIAASSWGSDEAYERLWQDIAEHESQPGDSETRAH
jgi:ppGpp synthetase/RelA/SpoT-type nucleotidyltranferase